MLSGEVKMAETTGEDGTSGFSSIHIRSSPRKQQRSPLPIQDDDTWNQEQSCMSESAPLLRRGAQEEEGIVVYHRRWYILFLAFVTSTLQMMVWNTWGPISDSAKLVFNWTNADVTTFANIGNVFYVVMALPSSYLLDVMDLRIALLVCITTNFLAATVRCISANATAMYWLCIVSGVLEGLGGPLFPASIGLLSATWFPAHERPISTGISTCSIYAGVATSLLLGPQIVQYVDPSAHNTTNSTADNRLDSWDSSNTSDNGNPIVNKQRDEIMYLMYLECAGSGVTLLAMLFYFPAKPPSPPSITAGQERVDFIGGLKQLIKSVQFWLLMIAFGTGGAVGSWCNIVAISLAKVNIDQTAAGYMGFFQTVLGCVLGIIVSILMTRFLRHAKAAIIAISLLAGVAFVWVILLREGYIPFSLAQMYASVIISGAAVPTVSPLFFEMACERFYPVAEGIIGGFLACTFNIFSLIVLAIFFIPNVGEDWIIPTMLACTLLTVPLMLGVRASYGRLDIDDRVITRENG